jgi:hypothetical protein
MKTCAVEFQLLRFCNLIEVVSVLDVLIPLVNIDAHELIDTVESVMIGFISHYRYGYLCVWLMHVVWFSDELVHCPRRPVHCLGIHTFIINSESDEVRELDT